MIHLIGISGKKQTGKDTVCKIIEMLHWESCADTTEDKYWDYIVKVLQKKVKYSEDVGHWTKQSFAHTLKKCLAEILDVPIEKLEDETFKNSEIDWLTDNNGKKYTVRRLLQEFGTDVGRKISPMIWCMPLMKKYDEAKKKNHPYWIITDVRFECEAEEIRKRGGLLIRVNRPKPKRDFIQRIAYFLRGRNKQERKASKHESETALDNYAHFNEVINSDGSLLDLVEKVAKISDKYRL